MTIEWDDDVHGEQLDSLLEAAEDSLNDGATKVAVGKLEEAMKLIQSTDAQGDELHITTLHQLATVWASQAPKDPSAGPKAVEMFESVLELTVSRAGKANKGYIATLRALADLSSKLNNHQAAIKYLTEACSILQDAGKTKGESYINLTVALAASHVDNGGHEQAAGLYDRAHRCMDAAGERDESGDRVMLNINWGNALAACGKHREALERFETAESMANRLLGRFNPMSAAALTASAKARAARAAAGPVSPSQIVPENMVNGDSGAGVGGEDETGDGDGDGDGDDDDVLAAAGFTGDENLDPAAENRKAITQYESALTIYSVVSGEDSEEYGSTALALADLASQTGSLGRAASAYKDAANGLTGMHKVRALNAAGLSYRAAGHVKEAAPCYASALEELVEVGVDGEGTIEQAEALVGSGFCSMLSKPPGDPADALTLLTRARDSLTLLGMTGSHTEGVACLAMGIAHGALSQHEKAVELFTVASPTLDSDIDLFALNEFHWGLSLVALVQIESAKEKLKFAQASFVDDRTADHAAELHKISSVLAGLGVEDREDDVDTNYDAGDDAEQTDRAGDNDDGHDGTNDDEDSIQVEESMGHDSQEKQASWDENQNTTPAGATPIDPISETIVDAEDAEPASPTQPEHEHPIVGSLPASPDLAPATQPMPASVSNV